MLEVVRRDNKRGYCRCTPGNSVDQLVSGRPGCLVRSSDPEAALSYLVEVSEDAQRSVLERAFAGDYDRVLVPWKGDGSTTESAGVDGLCLRLRAELTDPSDLLQARHSAFALSGFLRRLVS